MALDVYRDDEGSHFSGLADKVSIFPQILGLVASDIGAKELEIGIHGYLTEMRSFLEQQNCHKSQGI